MQIRNALMSLAGGVLALVALVFGAVLGLLVFVLTLIVGLVTVLVVLWQRRFASRSFVAAGRSRRAAGRASPEDLPRGRVIDGTVVRTPADVEASGRTPRSASGPGGEAD